MNKENIGTLARAITTVIVAVLGVLTILGVNVPIINENTLTAVISALLYVGVLAWSHWKNNDYTIEAKIKTKEMREMKRLRTSAGNGAVDALEHEIKDPKDVKAVRLDG